MKFCECGCRQEVTNRFINGHQCFGRKMSEESRKKISEGNRGKHRTEEAKRKISKKSKGRTYSADKYPNFGMRNKHHTSRTKKKMSISLTGHTYLAWSKGLTKETDERVKMRGKKTSVGLKKYFNAGGTTWSKGLTKETDSRLARLSQKLKGRRGHVCWTKGLTKETDERIMRMSIKNKGHERTRTGRESNLWHGGISFGKYGHEFNDRLKNSTRKRYKYVCQSCGDSGNAVHHLDYDKKNNYPENLIVLCARCNVKVNWNRDYWARYFRLINSLGGLQGIMRVRK